jgi:hypothetical protein
LFLPYSKKRGFKRPKKTKKIIFGFLNYLGIVHFIEPQNFYTNGYTITVLEKIMFKNIFYPEGF